MDFSVLCHLSKVSGSDNPNCVFDLSQSLKVSRPQGTGFLLYFTCDFGSQSQGPVTDHTVSTPTFP